MSRIPIDGRPGIVCALGSIRYSLMISFHVLTGRLLRSEISGVKVWPILLDDSSAILPLQHVLSGLVFYAEAGVS
jgi:hypothetical protein